MLTVLISGFTIFNMSNLYFYVSDSLNPYLNISKECFFVEQPLNGVVLYLWSNERTVVIGKHQNAARECDVRSLLADGGTLARRYSGGGAVFHDAHNLNFTFVAQSEFYNQNKHFDVIVNALKAYGLNAVVSGRNDMETDGKKFSGNAFYSKNGIKLHHGTILIDTDKMLMQKYLTVSKEKLVAHGVESVKARVVNLKELKPDIKKEDLIVKLRESFEKTYNTNAVDIKEKDFDASYIKNKQKFLASNEWLYGFETYENSVEQKFGWGKVEVNYKVEKDVLTGVNIFTDSLDVDKIEEIKTYLIGKKLSGLSLVGEAVTDDVIGLLIK